MDAFDFKKDLQIKRGKPQTLISPNNPTPTETIYLSNIDQQLAFPVETVFFYEAKPIISNNKSLDIVQIVKNALSEKLLKPYYFLAGRLDFNIVYKRLELVCNNAGISFTDAISELRLQELGDLSLPNPLFRNLILQLEGFASLLETPVFTVQVTKFKCGGFSIGFVTNHSIMDGRSAAEMFQNLASICRGEETNPENYILNTDRSCIKSRNPLEIKFEHKEYTKQADSNFTSPSNSTQTNNVAPLSLSNPNETPRFKLVSLNAKIISLLKQKAMIKCSSFEAVVAHIWKSRTRALFALYKDQTRVSSVLFAVDIRGKMSPPLPIGFVGNAVITASASAIVKDLFEKPFSFCVETVKEGIKKVTSEYVRSAIDWLEINKGVPAVINGNFFVSAWWKLPFHELDFGWGRPVYGGPLVTDMNEFVLLLSGENNNDDDNKGGINVWISLEKEKMDKFLSYLFEV